MTDGFAVIANRVQIVAWFSDRAVAEDWAASHDVRAPKFMVRFSECRVVAAAVLLTEAVV